MKKWVFPATIVAILMGLYEQSKDKPNVYVLIAVVIVFMVGVMQLSAKTLHHGTTEHETKEDELVNKEENDNKG
jgi:hypothetical protein